VNQKTGCEETKLRRKIEELKGSVLDLYSKDQLLVADDVLDTKVD
jgi:hypothetical protein